jgi:hypothetical protein
MPRPDPLAQLVVTSMSKHRHGEQRIDAALEREREPVRDHDNVAVIAYPSQKRPWLRPDTVR